MSPGAMTSTSIRNVSGDFSVPHHVELALKTIMLRITVAFEPDEAGCLRHGSRRPPRRNVHSPSAGDGGRRSHRARDRLARSDSSTTNTTPAPGELRLRPSRRFPGADLARPPSESVPSAG